MSVLVKDIFHALDRLAPSESKMDFDNVGLLVGKPANEVNRVLIALDITDEVIQEAAEMGAQLIVSHHPVIFSSLKQVVDTDLTGHKVISLISSGLSAICMHTNLDAAQGGVNDALADALGAKVEGVLNREEGISRLARLPEPVGLVQFLEHTAAALGCNGLRYHDAGKPVSYIGLCGGAGGGDIALAAQLGCDTFVTADVKYNQFLDARALEINLIDADHFCTENVVVPVLERYLKSAFPTLQVYISKRHQQTALFFIPV